MVHIYNGILLSYQKERFSTFAATWTAVQEIMLSEISQAEKELSYDFSHLWNIRTRRIGRGRKG